MLRTIVNATTIYMFVRDNVSTIPADIKTLQLSVEAVKDATQATYDIMLEAKRSLVRSNFEHKIKGISKEEAKRALPELKREVFGNIQDEYKRMKKERWLASFVEAISYHCVSLTTQSNETQTAINQASQTQGDDSRADIILSFIFDEKNWGRTFCWAAWEHVKTPILHLAQQQAAQQQLAQQQAAQQQLAQQQAAQQQLAQQQAAQQQLLAQQQAAQQQLAQQQAAQQQAAIEPPTHERRSRRRGEAGQPSELGLYGHRSRSRSPIPPQSAQTHRSRSRSPSSTRG